LLENISLNDSELAGLGWQCLEEYHSFRSSVLSMLSKLDRLEQQLVKCFLITMVVPQGKDNLVLKLKDSFLSWPGFAGFNYQFSLTLA